MKTKQKITLICECGEPTFRVAENTTVHYEVWFDGDNFNLEITEIKCGYGDWFGLECTECNKQFSKSEMNDRFLNEIKVSDYVEL